MMHVANRIPAAYVLVSGVGQTDFGAGADPWSIGSFDAALHDAGIQNCNIMYYSSVLPPGAQEITLKDAMKAGLFQHGMVLESIMAKFNGVSGDTISAGVGTCQVFHEERLLGGYAAEYADYGTEKQAEDGLTEALERIVWRNYPKGKGYWYGNTRITTREFTVEKAYGTVLVSLSFVSYFIPKI